MKNWTSPLSLSLYLVYPLNHQSKHVESPQKVLFLLVDTELRVVFAIFLLVCFVCLKESTLETRKNVLYFSSKALFILQIQSSRGVLRNFVKFIGKHLRKSLCFKKVAGPRPATLLKKSLLRRCFLVNFTKFLRTPFLQSTSGRLLLQIFKCLDVIKCLSMKRNRHYWITWKVKHSVIMKSGQFM